MRKRSGKIFIQNNDYVKDFRVPGTYKKVVTTHVVVVHRKIVKTQTYPDVMFRWMDIHKDNCVIV